MSAQLLTATEIAALIEEGEPLPECLRAAVAKIVRDNTALTAALIVEQYIQVGKGKHDDPDAGGAYGLAGVDLNRDPSTVRGHHGKFKHLFP